MIENSPAFQRRDRLSKPASPEGTAEIEPSRPSLRDLPYHDAKPGVETPGYFQTVPSGQTLSQGPEILVAMGLETCATNQLLGLLKSCDLCATLSLALPNMRDRRKINFEVCGGKVKLPL